MTADLFWKKRIRLIFTGVVSTAIVICALIYAWMLTNVQKIVLEQSFHFIVSESQHVEAGAHFVSQSGGAGYVMCMDDAEYVVFSVYLKGRDANKVQASLREEGEETNVVIRHVDTLYLKNVNRQKMETIKGAFSSLYGCIEVLQAEITRLDKGATQQSTKRVLSMLKDQFGYLKRVYRERYPAFSAVCERVETRLEKEIQTTVFVKNLRYLQCETCVSYLKLAEEFSL